MPDRVICHHPALPHLRKKDDSTFHKLFENEYRVKGTSNYLPPPQTEAKTCFENKFINAGFKLYS